ncbi:MAG: hypothetical protein KDB37_11125 [Ilumatobacter sp.]|nr:hypothetical protein [Ilumatobacter sp.]
MSDRLRCNAPGGCGRWVVEIDRKRRAVLSVSYRTTFRVLRGGEWSRIVLDSPNGRSLADLPVECDAVEADCRCGQRLAHHFPPHT